jgi:hypothetical protein
MDAEPTLTLEVIQKARAGAARLAPALVPVRGWRLWRIGQWRCLPWRRYFVFLAEPGSDVYTHWRMYKTRWRTHKSKDSWATHARNAIGNALYDFITFAWWRR